MVQKKMRTISKVFAFQISNILLSYVPVEIQIPLKNIIKKNN